MAALFCLPGVAAHAQFIRIGPFDFEARAGLAGIYTTNVDGVRPDATDKEMKDYYAVASFDLTSSTTMFRNSKVDLSTGVTVEKHAKRSDLDTLSEPFGVGRIDTEFEFGRYTLRLNLAHDVTTETREDTYEPSSVKKKRDIQHITDYGAELGWQRNDLKVLTSVNGSKTRHDDAAYQIDDQDTMDYVFSADWQFSERLGLSYAYKRNKTEMINQPESYSGWDERNNVGLTFEILERPHFTYTLGAEQSSVQGETIDWEPTHTFTLDDHIDFSQRTRLRGNVSYKYAQKYAADEIALTCDVVLENDLSHTAHQSLTLSKQPAGTFGSTEKTDVTSVGYDFQKKDLFIYNLNFTFAASYKHNRPIGEGSGEIENVTIVTPQLSYDRAVSRKINRSLAYQYHWEHSNLQSENLTEHRVTLKYTYTF